MDDNKLQVWEKSPDESLPAWNAFTAYRDLGKTRTLALATQALGRPPGYKKSMERWSVKNNWVERCHAYDVYFDRMQQQALIATRRDTYQAKKQAQISDRERIGRTLINVSLRMIQILQVEITERLRHPMPMKAGEMASVLKASVGALELGGLMINEVITIEGAEQVEATAREETIISPHDPEALAREYRRIINAGTSE